MTAVTDTMMTLKKILIVEDTEVHRDLMQYELKDRYDLEFATDSQTALRLLRENRYDLVIIDFNLPPGPNERAQSGEGQRILQAIRDRQSDQKLPMKIVVVSSYLGDQDTIEAKEAGVDRIFDKPFSLYEFTDSIDRLWDDRE